MSKNLNKNNKYDDILRSKHSELLEETQESSVNNDKNDDEYIQKSSFDIFGSSAFLNNYTELSENRKSTNDQNNVKGNEEENLIDGDNFHSKEFYFKYLEDNHIELLFKDQFGEAFVYLKVKNEDDKNHYEILPLSGNRFEHYLINIL